MDFETTVFLTICLVVTLAAFITALIAVGRVDSLASQQRSQHFELAHVRGLIKDRAAYDRMRREAMAKALMADPMQAAGEEE